MLKRRKQQQVNKLGKFVEEIEALEAVNAVNRNIVILEDSIMLGTLALNQSAYMLSVLKGDPNFNKVFSALHNTAQVDVSNS